MNKDNPLANIILFIIIAIFIFFVWAITKGVIEGDKNKEDKTKEEGNKWGTSILKNIFYIIIGCIVIYAAAELWFATCGHDPTKGG